jgi:hypothetical protein
VILSPSTPSTSLSTVNRCFTANKWAVTSWKSRYAVACCSPTAIVAVVDHHGDTNTLLHRGFILGCRNLTSTAGQQGISQYDTQPTLLSWGCDEHVN